MSFDPASDTPARLAAKAKELGADPALWHFVTAPRDLVDEFGAKLGLSVLREGADGSNITHNLRTALLDRDGTLARTYNGKDWVPDEVIRDLQAVVNVDSPGPCRDRDRPNPCRDAPVRIEQECDMSEMVLLGDEAVALAAVHAGLTAAYGYPGTPSTEILEYLHPLPAARTAARAPSGARTRRRRYEAALGVSFAGRRAMVTMKHVGLNVAADPFMNSALVADQRRPGRGRRRRPGHAQLAERAGQPRSTPTSPASSASSRPSQQEAYDMTREAFDVSERFHIPVMIRLVTRLAHSRGIVQVARGARPRTRRTSTAQSVGWILLPGERAAPVAEPARPADEIRRMVRASRVQHRRALTRTRRARRDHDRPRAQLLPGEPRRPAGAALAPAHRRLSVSRSRRSARFVGAADGACLLLEEGYPFVERALRGIVPPAHARDPGPRVRRACRRTASSTPTSSGPRSGLPARAGRDAARAVAAEPAAAAVRGLPARRQLPRASSRRSRRSPTPSSRPTSAATTLGALPPLQRHRDLRLHGRVGRHGQGRRRRRLPSRRSRSSATAPSCTPA
ncbi:MAG: hypothetical protein M0C28_16450 [Candidatus Moduliflexus flocculans]|nr:hypothetical protein [Candidatus Moduliflexus flocculans]